MLRTVVSYSISTSNHNVSLNKWATELVVSYSISTSNHNNYWKHAKRIGVVSYSISTSNHNSTINGSTVNVLYLIPFLHQTTTTRRVYRCIFGCILFHFYIKPQLSLLYGYTSFCCILFHFYIKPQRSELSPYKAHGCILFHFYIKPQPTRMK